MLALLRMPSCKLYFLSSLTLKETLTRKVFCFTVYRLSYHTLVVETTRLKNGLILIVDVSNVLNVFRKTILKVVK